MILGIVIGCGLLAGCALNFNPTPSDLERYVDAAAKVWDFQGSVLVAKDDRVLLARGYGWKDREFQEKNTPNTRFFIGSLTKQFTAAAILQLRDEGKLSLDDLIARHLTDYPKATANRVTIRQLLTHTAGIPNYTEAPEVLINRTREVSPQTLLDVFKNRPLDFEPGTSFHYSNSGYIILGAIIEKLSGQSYEAYLHSHLLKPIGMFNSGYARREAAIPERATGYTLDANDSVVAAMPVAFSVLHTAGALYSTTYDLLEWDRALRKGEILSRDAIKTMLDDTEYGYAAGWYVDSLYGRTHTCHGGFLDGYVSTIDRWPDDDLCIIILSNQDEAPVAKMARAMAAIVFDRSYDFPVRKTPVEIAGRLLTEYEGVYRISDNDCRLVVAEGDTLFDLKPGHRPERLRPQARDVFFYNRDNTKILTFERDELDAIVGLVVYDEGLIGESKKLFGDEAQSLWIIRDAVNLRPERLDRFTGVYNLEADLPDTSTTFTLSITRHDNRLFALLSGFERVEMYPSSPTELFNQASDFRITFTEDSTGQLSRCAVHFGQARVQGYKSNSGTPAAVLPRR